MESLPEIYTRLSSNGWIGYAQSKFDQLDPFPNVRYCLVDGFDLLGSPVENSAPWFWLSANARAENYLEEPGFSMITFFGTGSSFLAALGSLLDDINRHSIHDCVWSDSPFSYEAAEAYISAHPLFGKTLPLCARFRKRCFRRLGGGNGEIHSVRISPFRNKAMVHDPFLSNIYADSRENLYRHLAYRIHLTYADQDILRSGIHLYFSNKAMLREDLYERAGFRFGGGGITFRFMDEDGTTVVGEPNLFENHMQFLEDYVLEKDRNRIMGGTV